MNLRNEFLAFIKRNQLFDLDDRVLLTVSGGLDSVVMMDLFDVCEIDFGIAHCNFQLGQSQHADARYRQTDAQHYRCPQAG